MPDRDWQRANPLIPEEPPNSGALLVADGESCARDPVVSLLEQAGYEVLTAKHGQEAVDVFRAHAEVIVAVLLDSRMSGWSGADIFDQLQHIRPNVPVITVSGYTEEEVIAQFLGLGVVGFLQKPFGRHTQLDAVRKAVDPPGTFS